MPCQHKERGEARSMGTQIAHLGIDKLEAFHLLFDRQNFVAKVRLCTADALRKVVKRRLSPGSSDPVDKSAEGGSTLRHGMSGGADCARSANEPARHIISLSSCLACLGSSGRRFARRNADPAQLAGFDTKVTSGCFGNISREVTALLVGDALGVVIFGRAETSVCRRAD